MIALVISVSMIELWCVANHPWIVENPQHVVANKGHNVTLRCKAESQSLNVIEFLWMKEDELLVKLEDVIITNSSGMSHVKLLNVNFEDAGRYYCIADNGFARKHSTVAEVKVYGMYRDVSGGCGSL